MTMAALEPQFWAAFCQAVGREDLLGQQFAPAVEGEPAYEELCALFKSRSRQEWLETLAAVDACCEPVYGIGEALDSPPVQALEMATDAGLLPAIRLSARPAAPPPPAPGLGEHTATLLAQAGYSQAEIEQLRAEGAI